MRKRDRVVLVSLLACLCVLIGALCAGSGVAFAESAIQMDITQAYPEASVYGQQITLGFEYHPYISAFSASGADIVPYVDMRDNALVLEVGGILDSISVSYKQGGETWIPVTEDNCSDLPGDAGYQFLFSYSNLHVSELIAAGGQMVYDGIPDWFKPQGDGSLVFGTDPVVQVARIETVGGRVVITFNEEWLADHADDVLSGTFKVEGKIDWRSVPEDGNSGAIPGVDINLSFEKNLSQRYGVIDIEKSSPTLITGENGKYYLKYEVTVSSRENVAIPDVYVFDRFVNGAAAYVERYVGVTSQDRGLASRDQGGYEPWETSDAQNAMQGTLRSDSDGMYWTIGTLQPNETRTLTYCAEIKESYVSELINNPIVNQADVYSGENWKDVDASSFMPKNSVRLTKSKTEAQIGPTGDGTITYTLTITAPADNSFTLRDLTLTDGFPEELSSFLSGDEGGAINLEIATTSADGQTTTRTAQAAYSGASFAFSDLEIAPGDTVTVTYTVKVKNIFLSGSGEIELVNYASVGKGDKRLSGASDTHTLQKQTWMRKSAGNPLTSAETVNIPTGSDIYTYNGGNITKENSAPSEFTVPKDSIKYQVVLNENGQWDLSSASMQDTLSDSHFQYVGYVKVELYKRTLSDKNPSDSELNAELDNLPAVRTVWLKINGRSEFAFKPTDLLAQQGLETPMSQYAYRLTYYAQPVDMEDVGSVMLTNHFRLKGTVGVGNGFMDIPSVEIAVSQVVQGGAHYDAEKISWYYEPYPVYKTKPMADNTYPEEGETGYAQQYGNGAIYWIIRLEGNIGPGTVNGTGNGISIKEGSFYITDEPDKSEFRRDSVVGVYEGPKGLDFAEYGSYEAFAKAYEEVLKNQYDMEKLAGNPQNDQWFSNTAVSNAVYKWYASDSKLNYLVFPNGYTLGNDRVLYIVLRTTPTSALPTGVKDHREFTNTLSIASGGSPVTVNTAQYVYDTKTSLFKESKGAYIYDKAQGTFVLCSDERGGDWKAEDKIDKDALPTNGIYAAWLLNVNWNGSMQGEAYVSDMLPAGMELVYVDVNNFGPSINRTPSQWPKTVSMQELNGDPAWRELKKSSVIYDRQTGVTNETEAITYYNPTTGELRWHITGLTASGTKNSHEINLRIICKVVDPELFLNQVKTYVNNAAVIDPQTGEPVDADSASVTIRYPIGKGIDLVLLNSLGGSVDGNGNVDCKFNRLPFKLEINPSGEDMCPDDTLPALIDEMSSGIELIEDTLEIRTASGALFTNFTYDINKRDDGGQTLIIYGLPDGTPLTISYCVRMTSEPNLGINVSNTAYWAGYKKPDAAQVDIPDARYQPGGNVFVQNKISIEVIKTDVDYHSKRLSGAVFELYKYDEVGQPVELLCTGTTDSYGKVVFGQEAGTPELQFDTVYCLDEIMPPIGYELDASADNKYYFMIASKGTTKAAAIKEKYEKLGIELDIRYDGTDYSHEIVIENKKGTLSVTKNFVDEMGNEYVPKSGVYRFGLFDQNGQKLETLTIEYTENGARYFVGDEPMLEKDTPTFSKYDPERVYKVYELDAAGEPIPGDDLANIDSTYYLVSYSSEEVTVNSDVTVTNRRITEVKPKSLALSKRVLGQDAELDRVFTFAITVTGAPDGNYPIAGNPTEPTGNTIALRSGKATVKLGHGQCIVIDNLPEGASYTIEELDAEGYDVVATDDQGTIDADASVKASFVNYRVQEDAGKTVDDEDGVVEIGQTLTYTIRWANNGMAASVVITDVLNDGLTFVSASDGGTLGRDGKTVTWNLGNREAYSSGSVTVTVTVNANAGDDKTVPNSADIQIGDRQTAVESEVTLATGDLTVSKTVTGVGGDKTRAFMFTVTLGNSGISGTYGDMIFKNGVARFMLKHEESRTATGLPAGIDYTVIETDNDGYEVTISGDAGWGVIEADAERQVAFVNNRTDGSDSVPMTGDNSPIERWLAIALASAACMSLIWRRRRAEG